MNSRKIGHKLVARGEDIYPSPPAPARPGDLAWQQQKPFAALS